MPMRSVRLIVFTVSLAVTACGGDNTKKASTPSPGTSQTDDPKKPIVPPELGDTTPPDTYIVTAPEVFTSATTATFTFSGSDDTAIAKYQCSLDGAAFADCLSPHAFSNLTPKTYSFNVRAVDAAGNKDPTPAAHSWTVDTLAPETYFTAGPAFITSAVEATFAFAATDTSAIREYRCRLNEAAYSTCASSKHLYGLTEAEHTFDVYAIDAAGNADPTPARYAWRVSSPAPALFVPNVLWTERLGQLVGTSRSPYSQIGLRGTDLGVAFPLADKLVILFGDSWTINGADWDVDSVAFTDPAYPIDGQLPPVTWMTQPGGRFLPLTVPGVALGAMNVPVDGFAVGTTTYAFFSTGYDWGNPAKHTHSVLAHTTAFDLGNMTLSHMVASTKFININVVIEGATAYLFGSGHYRKSAVFLARVPLATIADRDTWQYYQGGSGDSATFGPGETSAAVLVNTTDVGEFSVRKHPRLNLYLMAYNTGGILGVPRGIHLRTAGSPAGPWSAPIRIWNPDVHGYTYFMHAAANIVGYDDGLSEPGRENEWGGEYGPYFVPEWFDGPDTPDGAYSLVYLLSSWNPYTVHLIRTVLGPAGLAERPVKGGGLPWPTLTNGTFADGLSGWSASGHTFRSFSSGGKYWITTFTNDEGDAAEGQLWQDFTVNDVVNELRFQVHGGQAAVKLIHEGDVVFATRGRNTNDANTQVRWKLADYRGKTVRLMIDDDKTGAWGFISVSGFSFH
jgi:hypothetical protein